MLLRAKERGSSGSENGHDAPVRPMTSYRLVIPITALTALNPEGTGGTGLTGAQPTWKPTSSFVD